MAAAGPRGPAGPTGPGAIDLSGTLPGSDADFTTFATIGLIAVRWKCTATDVWVTLGGTTFRAQGTRYVDGVANAMQSAAMISAQASNPKTVGFDLLLASTPTDSASLRVLASRGAGGVCTVSGQLVR